MIAKRNKALHRSLQAVLWLSVSCLGQTIQPQVASSGTCSPNITQNQGQVNFTCRATLDSGTVTKINRLLNELIETHSGSAALDKKLDGILDFLRQQLPVHHGVLEPADDGLDSGSCTDVPAGNYALHVGRDTYTFANFPITVVEAGGLPLVTVTKAADRGIAISAVVRSADLKVVAQITDNQFTVNPNNSFDVARPDKSTLVVHDSYGEEVLRVRFLNRTSIRVAGRFYYAAGEKPFVAAGADSSSSQRGSCHRFVNAAVSLSFSAAVTPVVEPAREKQTQPLKP